MNFLKIIASWWSLVQIKSMSKGKQKQDIVIEPLESTNIIRFTKYMHKFATSFNEWMLLGNNIVEILLLKCYPGLQIRI